uniref:Large ribosomal subunit protein eL30 n=1 Tax=Salmo salar TaxID=8030 RepID=B5XDL1_SALSA|nr:60S ribosomal protein L30 [Salmo salar]
MVSSKKLKKNAENINSHLQLVMKSGKVTLGLKSTKKNIRSGRTRMVILANNLPKTVVSEIEYCCLISRIDIHYYNGANTDLGTACGKYFPVSVMGVTHAGDSEILRSFGSIKV